MAIKVETVGGIATNKGVLVFFLIGLSVRAFGETSSVTLSLPQAIERAIQFNVSMKLAQAATEEARGRALTLAAGLLPEITGSVYQTHVYKANLEAQGFPANGPFSSLLGPYNSFDARFQLLQSLFDLRALWQYKLGKSTRRVAELQEAWTRDQVAAATALAYLEAQRTERSVQAAQADLTLSESLFKLASDMHDAGISTGLDRARSETTAAQSKLRWIRAKVGAQEAATRFKRVVGLPLDTSLALMDLPRPSSPTWPTPDQAIVQATQARTEVQIAAETVRSAQARVRSAEAEHWPTIKLLAGYGYSGTTPSNTARTGQIGGRLDLPIFSGGATHGRVRESQAGLDDAQSRYRDMLVQVEEDVRLSLQTLSAEAEATATADLAANLARKEVKLARDRFSNGMGDNIQLLTAQTALDRALEDQVNVLARYDTARVNLATALGQIVDFK